MWIRDLKRPSWLEGRESTRWRDRAKLSVTYLLAACNPRLGQSVGDDGGVAWLNGLRGVAAFLVYCHHYNLFTPHGVHIPLWHSFGYDGQYCFGSLPLVRFFFAGGGRIAVALFFTISGFVLSYGPLRTIHSRLHDVDHQMATRIGTSFARRWLRLFLPVIITTFAYMTSWFVNPYSQSKYAPLTNVRHLFNIQSAEIFSEAPTATYTEEVWRWLYEFIDGSYVFHTITAFHGNDYNPHMWSIAVEYRGSLLVYVWALAMFAIGWSPRARFRAGVAAFLYLQFAVSGHFYAAFVAGILFCDLTLASELSPSQLPKMFKSQLFQKHKWIPYFTFAVGAYLGSVPQMFTARELGEEPGWNLLSRTVPASSNDCSWYFATFGAALMVTSTPSIRWFKRLFETKPAQYLGKVSFGLYLVHGPIMWTIGDRLFAAVGAPNVGADVRIPNWYRAFPISNAGPIGLELNYVLPHCILFPLTLWLAVIITNLVDTPSVKLSKHFFATRRTREVETSGAASAESERLLAQAVELLPR